MRLYVVGRNFGYSRAVENRELVDNIKDAEVVLFTGGEDVCPDLYGCKPHPYTYYTKKRDIEEMTAFRQMRTDQVAFCICRGVQLINILHGGLLVQNVYNHAIHGTHTITDGNRDYEITSLHHQMCYPFNIDQNEYDILFWSKRQLSPEYEGDKIDRLPFDMYGEPEIIRYHKRGFPLCLGVQGHPEMMPGEPVTLMINDLLNELIDENRQIYRGSGSGTVYSKQGNRRNSFRNRINSWKKRKSL